MYQDGAVSVGGEEFERVLRQARDALAAVDELLGKMEGSTVTG